MTQGVQMDAKYDKTPQRAAETVCTLTEESAGDEDDRDQNHDRNAENL